MQTLSPQRLTELRVKANDVRQGIIRSLLAAGSGHSAGSLDMADIFTALYGHLMRHKPDQIDWAERDRLLLSCGHIAPVRYSAMANFGYFPVEELLTLRKFGSRLQGHPERVTLPAVETTSGAQLSAMGYTMLEIPAWGSAQAVVIDPRTGIRYGGSDSRHPAGEALGY